MYMEKLKLFVAIMAVSCVFVGCKVKSAQTLAENHVDLGTTDSIVTDSVKFENIDSAVSCRIKVDFPLGEGALADSVRAMISRQLSLVSLPMVMSLEDSTQTAYAGSLSDGQAMVSHYGEVTERQIRKDQQELAAFNGKVSFQYQYLATLGKVTDTERYLTYAVDAYCYLGGAHGSSLSYAVNVDKATGETLRQVVDTTKTRELQPLLRAGVLRYFKDCEQEVKESELTSMLFIKDGIIPLPARTPTLVDDGVRFDYQQYEIGPYAMGIVSFTIPYADIKPWLTEQAKQLAGVAE